MDSSFQKTIELMIDTFPKMLRLNEALEADIKEFNHMYKHRKGFEKIDSMNLVKVGQKHYNVLVKIHASYMRICKNIHKCSEIENGDDSWREKYKITLSRTSSRTSNIVGTVFFISSFVVAGIFSYNLWIPNFLIVLALFFCGWGFLSRKHIECACGYHGKPDYMSKRDGCGLFLLLCIGILPGLIYCIVKPKKIECPWCGSFAK
jgi:hypothetical protein